MKEETDERPETWRKRLRSAAFVGASVALVSFVVGLARSLPGHHRPDRQARTQEVIHDHARVLEVLMERGQDLPGTLDSLRVLELELELDGDCAFRSIPLRWRSDRDGWSRPLRYAVDGERYEIRSLGRDGRPGGTGQDRDLSSGDPPWQPTERDPLDLLRFRPERWILPAAVASWLAGAGCALMTVLIDLGGPVSAGLRRFTIGLVSAFAIIVTSSALASVASAGAWS